MSGCRVSDFDLISGLTGTGVYLLTKHQVHACGPDGTAGDVEGGSPRGSDAASAGEAMLRRLLSGLVRLMADPAIHGDGTRPPRSPSGPLRGAYPHGLHNCGLAHGVPGPLALLSLAMLAGVRIPGASDAVCARPAGWPSTRQGPPRNRTGRTAYRSTAPRRASPGQGYVPGRAAWCYGAPGVARSLWLAGAAAGEPWWQDLAARTIRAVAARPARRGASPPQAFCHGEAGLLQVLRGSPLDLGDPAVASAARSLAAELAAEFDPGPLLGVRGADPDGVPVDQPGLLDGAAGVALALLGLPDRARLSPGPAWDRMFLLA